MNIIQTIIIGIVEGLTEFLPVSSTGHMMIAENLLKIPSSEFVKAFTVIVQFGAILSVLVLYWKRFLQSLNFYYKLLIAFIPAALLGPILDSKIDSWLGDVKIVGYTLIIGGVIMLFVDKLFNKPKKDQTVTYKNAFVIGCFQCFAMIPGVSRSMSSIVGGMTRGLTRKNAAEFSFFLAVPTMAAASGFKLFKMVCDLKHVSGLHFQFLMKPEGVKMLSENMPTLILGNVVAFVVALMAIKFFISFVTKHGFRLFGWYRIVVGVLILVLIWQGIM